MLRIVWFSLFLFFAAIILSACAAHPQPAAVIQPTAAPSLQFIEFYSPI
jgi:hypothetical protein